MKEFAKVLIVESGGDYCSGCAAFLQKHGFEVLTAPRDGMAVLQLIREAEPAVVRCFYAKVGRARRDEHHSRIQSEDKTAFHGNCHLQ